MNEFIAIISTIFGTLGTTYAIQFAYHKHIRIKKIKHDISQRYSNYLNVSRKYLDEFRDLAQGRSDVDRVGFMKYSLEKRYMSSKDYSDRMFDEVSSFRLYFDPNLFDELRDVYLTINGTINPIHLKSNQNNIYDLILSGWLGMCHDTIQQIDDVLNQIKQSKISRWSLFLFMSRYLTKRRLKV